MRTEQLMTRPVELKADHKVKGDEADDEAEEETKLSIGMEKGDRQTEKQSIITTRTHFKKEKHTHKAE